MSIATNRSQPMRVRLRSRRRVGFGLASLLVAALASVPARADDVLVFAAASLTDALTDVGAVYEQRSERAVTFSFASSSILARQIDQGAPADIYISANARWMDYAQAHDRIRADTRRDLLSNRLVLVAPRDRHFDAVEIDAGLPLAEMVGDARLAMGNPAHVPAGIYARQALETLGLWSSVEARVVRVPDVRAALALVALGEAPLGIVYRTDALASAGVRVIGMFPADSHEAIAYPVALTRAVEADDLAAREFFRFLFSDPARRVFEQHGFVVLDGDGGPASPQGATCWNCSD